jgi:hypothetical protein
VILRRATQLIGHIFVDGLYVYWSEGAIGDWQMMRQPKLGGPPSAIAKGTLRGSMVRATDGFYAITDSGLTALPDGKPERVLVASHAVSEVAIGSDSLFWTEYRPENSMAILTMPLVGGAPRVLACGQPAASNLWVANGMLHWANLGVPPLGGSQILGLPVGGGVPRTLVEGSQELFPWALRADAQWIYWVEAHGHSGYALYRAPVKGGERTLLGSSPTETMNRDNRDRIEFDETQVYWNARQSVARVPKSGGTVEEVVRLARGDVMSFTIDETDVYVAAVFF